MNNNYKYFIASIFLIFGLTISNDALATAPANLPTLGEQVCAIRWLFCGAVRTTLCAVAIITIGMLVLVGRMTWGGALVILMGIILFANAEYFAFMFTMNPRCFCLPTTIV